MNNEIRMDALLPVEMAKKAEDIGVKKANMSFIDTFVLAILAGAFIALGAVFATTVSAGSYAIKGADGALAFSTGLPYGVTRLLTGLVFTLGLILVVIGGAELFTGNNLCQVTPTLRTWYQIALERIFSRAIQALHSGWRPLEVQGCTFADCVLADDIPIKLYRIVYHAR